MDEPQPITIRDDDPASPPAAALIAHHLAEAHAATPAGFAYALDGSRLAAPDTRFFTAWRGEALAGMGALRRLAPDHAEIKSMRTAPGHQRQGVAGAMLAHLLATARADGVSRISLETGTQALFAPAIALYEAAGFRPCDAYGDYRPSPHNRFLHSRPLTRSFDAPADPHPPRPVRLEPGEPFHRLVGRDADRAGAARSAGGG